MGTWGRGSLADSTTNHRYPPPGYAKMIALVGGDSDNKKKAPHMDGRAHAVAQNTKNAHTWACGGSHRRQTMAAPVLRSRAPSGRRSVPALRTASPGAGSGSPLPPQWSPAPAPVHRGADVWSSGWAACRRDTSAPLPTWLVPSRGPPRRSRPA